jgi:hypothetical protein
MLRFGHTAFRRGASCLNKQYLPMLDLLWPWDFMSLFLSLLRQLSLFLFSQLLVNLCTFARLVAMCFRRCRRVLV